MRFSASATSGDESFPLVAYMRGLGVPVVRTRYSRPGPTPAVTPPADEMLFGGHNAQYHKNLVNWSTAAELYDGPLMGFTPCLLRTPRAGGGELIRLGHPLLDSFLDLAGDLPTEDGVLVPKHEQFGVFGGVPAQQHRGDGLQSSGQLLQQ